MGLGKWGKSGFPCFPGPASGASGDLFGKREKVRLSPLTQMGYWRFWDRVCVSRSGHGVLGVPRVLCFPSWDLHRLSHLWRCIPGDLGAGLCKQEPLISLVTEGCSKFPRVPLCKQGMPGRCFGCLSGPRAPRATVLGDWRVGAQQAAHTFLPQS